MSRVLFSLKLEVILELDHSTRELLYNGAAAVISVANPYLAFASPNLLCITALRGCKREIGAKSENLESSDIATARVFLQNRNTMCQLLGMNCADKTDCSFSFRGFCCRGGQTDIHSHGLGVAIYEGKGLRTFLDTLPATESPIAQLVAQYPIKTYNMMAHIRYATQGDVSLENVHPFQREMVCYTV
jgi:hypothetical protein